MMRRVILGAATSFLSVILSSVAPCQGSHDPGTKPQTQGHSLIVGTTSRTSVPHRFVPAVGTTGRLTGPIDPESEDSAPTVSIPEPRILNVEPGVYVLNMTGDVYRGEELLKAGMVAVPTEPPRIPRYSLEVGSYQSAVREETGYYAEASIMALFNGSCGGQGYAEVRISGTRLYVGPDPYSTPRVHLLPGVEYTTWIWASSSSFCGMGREELLDEVTGERITSCGFAEARMTVRGANGVSCDEYFRFSDCNPGSDSATCTATGGPALTYLNDPPAETWMIF